MSGMDIIIIMGLDPGGSRCAVFPSSCYRSDMPVLSTSLCASSSSSSSSAYWLPTSSSTTTPQLSNPSSAKPSSTLKNPAPKAIQLADFSLPLPDLPTHVKEKILSLEVMGVDSGRALSLNPALRTASLDSINSIISFLQSKGIHHKDLGRILGMCPKILTSSIRSDLSPVFKFLSQDLKVPESNYRRAINKCPRLLVASVRDQLKPALIYLQRLGFRDTDALAYQDPILLVSSVEKTLIPKLQYLVGLGLSWDEAVEMVLRCPGLFTFSIEKNFKPKYEYFVTEMLGALEELKEFPQFFAFSLEKRIKPRHQEMMDKGLKVPLSLMLKSTDEQFKELMQKG